MAKQDTNDKANRRSATIKLSKSFQSFVKALGCPEENWDEGKNKLFENYLLYRENKGIKAKKKDRVDKFFWLIQQGYESALLIYIKHNLQNSDFLFSLLDKTERQFPYKKNKNLILEGGDIQSKAFSGIDEIFLFRPEWLESFIKVIKQSNKGYELIQQFLFNPSTYVQNKYQDLSSVTIKYDIFETLANPEPRHINAILSLKKNEPNLYDEFIKTPKLVSVFPKILKNHPKKFLSILKDIECNDIDALRMIFREDLKLFVEFTHKPTIIGSWNYSKQRKEDIDILNFILNINCYTNKDLLYLIGRVRFCEIRELLLKKLTSELEQMKDNKHLNKYMAEVMTMTSAIDYQSTVLAQIAMFHPKHFLSIMKHIQNTLGIEQIKKILLADEYRSFFEIAEFIRINDKLKDVHKEVIQFLLATNHYTKQELHYVLSHIKNLEFRELLEAKVKYETKTDDLLNRFMEADTAEQVQLVQLLQSKGFFANNNMPLVTGTNEAPTPSAPRLDEIL
jgi:mevalonate kinase